MDRKLSQSSLRTENRQEDAVHTMQGRPLEMRNLRASPSPSRPKHLNALSPLQSLSPLQPIHNSNRNHTRNRSVDAPSASASDASGGLSRSSSTHKLSRSLSRRESVYASAAKWGGGDWEEEMKPPVGLFSRLTLVKAPAEATSLRRRAKSSSSLAAFTSMSMTADVPATSSLRPRRSFAASSFGGMSPMSAARVPSTPPTLANESHHRVHHSHGNDDALKPLSPEAVFEMAKSLSSPVVLAEGGNEKPELRRRKSSSSASSLSRRKSLTESPEKPLALEPVECIQLDQETLLPFVDRPAEVSDLIKHPSNEQLFILVKAAFPRGTLRANWKELPPQEWNWAELVQHMTRVTRAECSDHDFIFKARQAVRQRSVALWEKLGVCLGCDSALLNVGGEDGHPASWDGLGTNDENDEEFDQVWVEGLQAKDPEDLDNEKDLFADFGEIVEDDGQMELTAAMGGMETIGEIEEEVHPPVPQKSKLTPAQQAGLGISTKGDPFDSPSHQFSPLPETRPTRSKSFVGLQIMTSPSSPNRGLGSPHAHQNPTYERGPGFPLFPSSFSTMSPEPNLGRSVSMNIGMGMGMGGGASRNVAPVPVPMEELRGGGQRWGLTRKASGAGLSESAITFGSESEYSASAPGDHR